MGDARWRCRTCAKPDGVVVDFQNGINDERVAAVAGASAPLGCVITIGAGMYEPGHAMRTDTGSDRLQDRRARRRATRRARASWRKLMSDVAATKVTTNLFGASGGRSSP